jgi:divalent metal cation (Fe/Co/Zn/Cd) transporter
MVVVVAADLSTFESHEIATKVEQTIRSELPVEMVTVHIGPRAEKPGVENGTTHVVSAGGVREPPQRGE